MRLLDVATTADLPYDAIGDHLARYGVVMIRHGSMDEVSDLLAGWTEPVGHPHESRQGITFISPTHPTEPVDELAGFTREPLAPHTDRSLQHDPPSVLATVLLTSPTVGGHALIADGARVLAELHRSFAPDLVAGLRLCAAGRTIMPVVTSDAGLVTIRYRDDRVASPRVEGEDQQIVAALRRAMSAATTPIRLERGDGYILHNRRYLHGRTGFVGHRRLARLLAKVTCPNHTWLNRGFYLAAA